MATTTNLGVRWFQNCYFNVKWTWAASALYCRYYYDIYIICTCLDAIYHRDSLQRCPVVSTLSLIDSLLHWRRVIIIIKLGALICVSQSHLLYISVVYRHTNSPPPLPHTHTLHTIYTHEDAYKSWHACVHVNSYKQACTNTQTHKHTHTYTHTHIHTHISAHTYTHTQTNALTHTHTHFEYTEELAFTVGLCCL